MAKSKRTQLAQAPAAPAFQLVPTGPINKLINVAVVGGVLVGGGWFINKQIKKAKRTKAESQAFKTTEGKQAILLMQAIEGAGTNEEAIFNVGRTIKNWPKVVSIYKSLYDASLEDDLRGDLGQDELNKFLTLVSDALKKLEGKQTGDVEIIIGDSLTDTKNKGKSIDKLKGGGVVTTALTNIRAQPEISFLNRTGTAKQGVLLGALTGQEHRDEDSGTLFVQVQGIMKVPFGDNKKVTFWVAKSQIGVYMTKKKALSFPFFFLNWSPQLGAISFMPAQPRIVTVQETYLRAPNLKRHKLLRPRVMVGNKMMEMEDKKGNKFIQLCTPQNQVRWIDADSVIELV